MADSAVKIKTTINNFHVVISALIVAFVLAGYAVLGFFVRPEADDFCFAIQFHDFGLFKVISYCYQNWLGRFSQLALTGFFSYLGPYGSQLSPVVLLFGLVSGTWYALRPFTRYALCLSLAGVYTFVAALPTPWQSLYWQSAAHTYIAPLVVTAFMLGFLFRYQHPILTALLGFFACGFNEGFSPVLIASLIVVWFVRSDLRPITSAAIVGALIGTLMLFTAPANFDRSAFANKGLHPTILKTAYLAFREGFQFLVSCGFRAIVPLLLTGSIAVCAFPEIRLPRSKYMFLILIFTLAAISFSGLNLIPALWAGSGSAPGRVYAVNVVILVLFIAAGFVISCVRLPNLLIIILAIITAILSFYTLMNTASRLIPYSREFDKGHLTDTYAEIAQLKHDRQPECYKAWKKIWFPESDFPNQ